MPTKQELEQLDPMELARLCQRVAEDPSNYTKAIADEAFKLKLEWVSLQTAPHPSLKEQEKNEAQMETLKNRTIKFLAGIP